MQVADETIPFLSVVIPTLDRSSVLEHTLAELGRQDRFEGGFEVVVVDNGSTDQTPEVLGSAEASMPYRLTALAHPEGGPAAARNAGVDAASGEVILLLGDDMAPATSSLLAEHAALHLSLPGDEYAVLGQISWSPRLQMTRFMSWLDRGGPQFHFWELEAGTVDAADYFYSSHLSLKRATLRKANGFDERFPVAAVEDTDLGSRLSDDGMTLEYHPELLVWHDHPTTLDQSLDRAIRVGQCAALYNSIRSERPHHRVQGPGPVKGFVGRMASPALVGASHLPAPRPVQEKIWSLAHRCNFARGYLLGPLETP